MANALRPSLAEGPLRSTTAIEKYVSLEIKVGACRSTLNDMLASMGRLLPIDKQDHFAEQAVRAYAVDQIVYKDEGTGIAIRPSVARNEDEIILRAGYIAAKYK